MFFPFFHVDAFTDKPFSGNQAGVCIISEDIPVNLMQQIAAENNLAETAFVKRNGNKFSLRWFTPAVEIPLCGHGTIATAHILWQEGLIAKSNEIVFETLSGELVVKGLSENWIELNFPSFPSQIADLPQELQDLFDEAVAVSYTNDRYLVELKTEEEVINFKLDFEKLKNVRLVITCRAREGSPYDFLSRYFAVPVGVPEDPVTGSAHCSLGPYWSKQLNKTNMLAFQASPRGGIIKVRLSGGRVMLAGKAVTIFKGQYKI